MSRSTLAKRILVGFVAGLVVVAPACATAESTRGRNATEQLLSENVPEPAEPASDARAPSPSTLAEPTIALPATEPVEVVEVEATPAAAPIPVPTPAITSTPVPSDTQIRLESLITPWLTRDLEVSVSIAGDDGVLFEHDPTAQLFPASNQKLLTAIGAYELLTPDHRFVTSVVSTTAPVEGVLDGDIILVAGGDPTLTRADVQQLAADVAATGISMISGDLVVDASRYDAAVMAPGWQDWQMPAHVGPLSALIVDDNRWRSDDEYVADPALANATLFRDALASLGVGLQGSVRVGTARADVNLFASHRSAPIGDLIPPMLRTSDNEIAESIVREIGVVVARDGSTVAGLAAISQRLVELGVDLTGTDGDGSGLSRANLHSARHWRTLLVFAQTQPWFADLYDALPVSGQSGTMTDRLTGPETSGRVAAKTGTIIGGRALSGYALHADGEVLVFSIIVNGEASFDALALIDNLVIEALTSAG